MTNNLAQRAPDELNVESSGKWAITSYASTTIRTVSRLLTRIDELEAMVVERGNGWIAANQKLIDGLTRRSEPMPEPVERIAQALERIASTLDQVTDYRYDAPAIRTRS